MPCSRLGEALEALAGEAWVEALDAFQVYWHRLLVGGERVTAVARLDTGSPYLWHPVSRGQLPEKAGEALVSARLAAEKGLEPGSTLEAVAASGERLLLRVTGVAVVPLDNGLAVLLAGNQTPVLGEPDECMLLVEVEKGRPLEQAMLEAKEVLADHGILVTATAKEETARRLREAGLMLKMFMLVMASRVLVAGLLGLVLVGILDLAAHLYEVGVLRSIGYTDTGVALPEAALALAATTISAPLALGLGYLLASHMAELLVQAFGYMEPTNPPASLLETLPAPFTAITLAALAWRLYPQLEARELLVEA